MAEQKGRTGKPIQVYLDEETAAEVEQLAEANGRPVSAEIRHAIKRHLAAPPYLVTPGMGDEASEPKPRGRPKRQQQD